MKSFCLLKVKKVCKDDFVLKGNSVQIYSQNISCYIIPYICIIDIKDVFLTKQAFLDIL